MTDGKSATSHDQWLLPDPTFPWPTANPYDVLNSGLRAIGKPELSPNSSIRDIQDAFFELQVKPSPEIRRAWDQLRRAGPRLLVDFCLYPVPPLDTEAFEASLRDLPLPVEIPDLVHLLPPPAPMSVPEPIALKPIRSAEIAAAARAAALRDSFVEGLPSLVDVIEDSNE